jgi:hypothetical protein
MSNPDDFEVGVLPLLPAAEDDRDAAIIKHCDRAIAELREARDIAQVRAIAAWAQAFSVYVSRLKAARRAQNHARLVTLLAERYIGAELRRARDRNEIGAQGRRSDLVPAGNEVRPTITEIGLSRRRALEAQRLAEGDEGAILDAVERATMADLPISCASVLCMVAPTPSAPDRSAAEEAMAMLRELAGFSSEVDPSDAARGVTERQVSQARLAFAAFDAWRARCEAVISPMSVH